MLHDSPGLHIDILPERDREQEKRRRELWWREDTNISGETLQVMKTPPEQFSLKTLFAFPRTIEQEKYIVREGLYRQNGNMADIQTLRLDYNTL